VGIESVFDVRGRVQNELPELWLHQKQAIGRAHGRSDFALFFEPGCGKTRTLLEIVREHYNREARLLHTLILAPVIVCPNWFDEIKKYTKIDVRKVILLTGPGPRRLKALAQARMKYPDGFIAVTNYEALVSIKHLYEDILDWAPEVLVLDESQRVKAHNSKRTKAVHAIARKTKFRYLLSGTPVLNSPQDLWGQFKAMDNGREFGDNFWSFRAKYFVDKNAAWASREKHFPNWQLRPGATEEFNRKIHDNAALAKKSECLDLPPLVRQVLSVEMSPEQKRHYAEMKNEFITFLGDSACTAQLAITKALRLQQIVSGHMPLDTEERDVIEFKDTPREAAFEEALELILEDPKHKALVWMCWKHNYAVARRVCEKLGVEYVEVHGDVSASAKVKAIERFNTDPNCRVYIGHPGAGGVGVNLIQASYAIYYSRSFTLEHDLQSEARNYRGGSEIHACITRIDLVAAGTIDEEIQKALANKVAIGESLLRSIKDRL
jgi:SNF2 family DNA or RNA helicase